MTGSIDRQWGVVIHAVLLAPAPANVDLNTCFVINIPWKFGVNPNIFHGDIEENVSCCFTEHSVYCDCYYSALCVCDLHECKYL